MCLNTILAVGREEGQIETHTPCSRSLCFDREQSSTRKAWLHREKSITKGKNMALDGGGERGKGGESQGGGSDAVGAQRKGTSSGIGKPESFKKEMTAKMRPREYLGVDHRAWGEVFQRGNSTW